MLLLHLSVMLQHVQHRKHLELIANTHCLILFVFSSFSETETLVRFGNNALILATTGCILPPVSKELNYPGRLKTTPSKSARTTYQINYTGINLRKTFCLLSNAKHKNHISYCRLLLSLSKDLTFNSRPFRNTQSANRIYLIK